MSILQLVASCSPLTWFDAPLSTLSAASRKCTCPQCASSSSTSASSTPQAVGTLKAKRAPCSRGRPRPE